MKVPVSAWATPRLNMAGCVLYAPLWRPDLAIATGGTFRTKDRNAHVCTVTGALWTPQGRLYDRVDDDIEVAMTPPNYPISVGVWTKPLVHKVWNMHIAHFHWSNQGGWGFLSGDLGQMVWSITTVASTANSDVADTINMTVGQWYFFVGTYDGTNQRMYRDGSLIGTTPLAALALDVSAGVSIGLNNGGNTVNGVLGEGFIYNRVLSLPEVVNYHLATRWRYK